MKERPILMSGQMVLATLREVDPKTHTRRIVKPQLLAKMEGLCLHGEEPDWCPYGKPGDRLWVRESFCLGQGTKTKQQDRIYASKRKGIFHQVIYRADVYRQGDYKWRPSIHMPRWASRINLEIINVRVERLQEISEEDAKAEGVRCGIDCPDHRIAFGRLWDAINGKRASWASNPWVWVIEFKRVAA